MTDFEKLQYAKARLAVSRLVGDEQEITKWAEHVGYWHKALRAKSQSDQTLAEGVALKPGETIEVKRREVQ